MAILPLLSCLLLALCTLSLSAEHVFVSIDCGSSATFKDENGIVWTGDDEYVKSGEPRSVRTSSPTQPEVMDTLRVFTNKTNNCYTINSMKQGRVLLRATFYYGNYDGKNSPPRFDLIFDGYFWSRVNNSGPLPSRFEVIYVMKKESITVCVSQLNPGQFPYISALEVRSLEPSMYKASPVSYPLFTKRRVAFGANDTIRYPDDPYDRQWARDLFQPSGTIQVSSDALLSSGMLTDDNPPSAVLKGAITSVTPNSSIDLYMAFSTVSVDYNFSVYINMYFSEVTRLKPNQTRSFYVAQDNVPFPTLVLPPYENVTELFASNISVSSNTTFSLVPANNSTLPPLINAMEVYLLGDYPLGETDKRDVKGLASLQKAFSLLQDWTSDPCLPDSDFAWEWVKCKYEDDFSAARVTTLILGSYGLSGLVPDFSSMDALETINLSNNSLRGSIPDFLGKLPNLQILNLENNQFNGTIPASLSMKKGLILRLSGNPGLCSSNTSCSVAAPTANSSVRKTKKFQEILFATIIPSIILLQLSF